MSQPLPRSASVPVAPRTLRLDVLVVDRDAGAGAGVCAAVRSFGHRCRVVASVPDALRLHREHPADVIVSDWATADFEGADLCREVRAADRGSYTYLLFASAGANKRDLVDAIRAGADDCLPKPIDVDVLEARLLAAARVLGAYRALARQNVDLRHDSRVNFRVARVDPLTGVANRLRLEEDLEALQAQVSRYRRRLSVAMCDLDDFKRYNDHFGHLAGDEALRRIAHAIRSSLRRADHVYRYGGEEFLVVLPEQPPAAAAAAMDRVRRAVEELAIPHAPGAGHPVMTVSIGLASVGLEGHDGVPEAIARADRALYRAKQAGRNRSFADGT